MSFRTKWSRWFRTSSRENARATLGDYSLIGRQHPHFLRDVAKRGGMFAAAPLGVDATALAILEGRRQMALETLELARVRPEQILGLIDKETAE